MKHKFNLLAGAAAVALAFAATPAFAGAAPCINDIGYPGPIGAGSSTGCQYLITANSNGTFTLKNETATNGANYDGSDDVEVGVINNSGKTLTALNLTGSSIGSFESDGISTYGGGSNSSDSTGYGGPQGYFTNNNTNSLTVNFVGGLAAGGSTYFSLEEPPTSGSGTLQITGVPEPMTAAILGSALLGLGIMRRRQRG